MKKLNKEMALNKDFPSEIKEMRNKSIWKWFIFRLFSSLSVPLIKFQT